MREMTLGQIAYEAHFGETAGDYALQSTRQQERWQRSAEAVLAAAREREAGLAAMVERLREELEWQREALDCGYFYHTGGKVSCQECSQQGDAQTAIKHTDECAFGRIEVALSLTPPAALDALRRRERSIGAAEELERLADSTNELREMYLTEEFYGLRAFSPMLLSNSMKQRAAKLRQEVEGNG